MTTLAKPSANTELVDESRKQEEIDFHNRRERDRQEMSDAEFQQAYSNKKWYAITQSSRDYADNWLKENCDGKVALDYCCGLGGMSLRLAEAGAFVHGIDISDESVTTAENLLQENGFGDRCSMQVMDAERLTYEDNSFDIIVCSGVLHHLDLNRAYPELSRVLKPTGKIICMEALGHNPAINLYRKLTPHLRTAWEVDHILKAKDLKLARDFFDGVSAKYFHLSTIGAVPFRNTPIMRPLLATLEGVDALLLRIPGVRQMAWQMIFVLSQPKERPAQHENLAA